MLLQILHQFLARALLAGLGQLQNQLGHGEEFRLQAHLAGFHANGNGQMRLAGADWAVEDEVLVLPDEPAALQLFAAKQRRELDVAFKGLADRDLVRFMRRCRLFSSRAAGSAWKKWSRNSSCFGVASFSYGCHAILSRCR